MIIVPDTSIPGEHQPDVIDAMMVSVSLSVTMNKIVAQLAGPGCADASKDEYVTMI